MMRESVVPRRACEIQVGFGKFYRETAEMLHSWNTSWIDKEESFIIYLMNFCASKERIE